MKAVKILLLLVFILGLQAVKANSIQYGDSTVVSLLTCEPGDALYAKFGHTAIRIRDNQGLDLVYNYGIFDFNTRHFYWKFLRGQTDYKLGVYPTVHFLEEYRNRNSIVWEQRLNMNAKEKHKLIELLHINYQPENRVYRYNYVYDNCATRPYDIIDKALDGVIVGNYTEIDKTFRESISEYLVNDAWAHVGINLVLGLEADAQITEYVYNFLPDNLMKTFQRAHVLSLDNGQYKKELVGSTEVLVHSESQNTKQVFWWISPISVTFIWLLAGIFLTFMKERKSKVYRVFDSILYFVSGIAGLVVFMFTFFSEHALVENNLNILWLSPLNVFVAFMIWNPRTRKVLFFYNFIYLMTIVVYVVVTVFLVHTLDVATIPMMLLLFLRTLRREERLLHILIVPDSKGLRWKK